MSTKARPKKNDIPESSLTSAITTDLPNTPEQEEAGAKTEVESPANDVISRAARQGIGRIRVDGGQLDYVGVAPARDQTEPKTSLGMPIGPTNSTFTPLQDVPFSPSQKCRDPKTGEFYIPADGVTSWEGVEYEGNKLIADE